MLALEDVHWIDPTSASWLAWLIDRLIGAAVLPLVTARPGYQPPWGTHARVTQLALPPLGAEESQAIVAAVPGMAQLPAVLRQHIVAHGAGNPFLVEELAWHAQSEHGLAVSPVPATVHAVLAARIGRLPAAAKLSSRRLPSSGARSLVRCSRRATCPRRMCTGLSRTCAPPSSSMRRVSSPTRSTPSSMR